VFIFKYSNTRTSQSCNAQGASISNADGSRTYDHARPSTPGLEGNKLNQAESSLEIELTTYVKSAPRHRKSIQCQVKGL